MSYVAGPCPRGSAGHPSSQSRGRNRTGRTPESSRRRRPAHCLINSSLCPTSPILGVRVRLALRTCAMSELLSGSWATGGRNIHRSCRTFSSSSASPNTRAKGPVEYISSGQRPHLVVRRLGQSETLLNSEIRVTRAPRFSLLNSAPAIFGDTQSCIGGSKL